MKKRKNFWMSLVMVVYFGHAFASDLECSYDPVLKPMLVSDSGAASVGDSKPRPCDQPHPLCGAHLMCGEINGNIKKKFQVVAFCPAINNQCPHDAIECFRSSVIKPTRKEIKNKMMSIR